MEAKVLASLDRRLARVEGQVRGLRRMIREGSYCIEVLNQLSAVRAALDQFGARLATAHVESCLLGAGQHPHSMDMSREELLEELQRTLSKLMR